MVKQMTNNRKYIVDNWHYALIYCLIVGLISVYLGQDMSYDLRNYHFYNPYMLLNNRLEFDIMPAAIQTFLNPLIDIPFFVSVFYLHIPSIFLVFLTGIFHGINPYLIHNIVYFSLKNINNLYRLIFSIIASVTSIFGAGFFGLVGTTTGDNTISILVLGSILVLTYSLYQHEKLNWQPILLSGFMLGLSAGLKLTASVYPIGLLVAMTFISDKVNVKIYNLLTLISGILVGFFISSGYWIIQLWKNYHNPFFPFFNNIFNSPYASFESIRDIRFLPRDIWQTLFYPFYFINQPQNLKFYGFEHGFSDMRLAVCYILVVLFVIFVLINCCKPKNKLYLTNSHSKTEFTLIIVPFFIVSYITWQKIFSIYRYAIPLELLSPVLIISILNYIFQSEKKIFVTCLMIFTLMIVTVHPLGGLHRIRNWKISSSYFGIESRNLVKYDNTIILTSGWGATAYIVPYFPDKTRFVKVGIPGFQNTLMQKKIVNTLHSYPQTHIHFMYSDYDKLTDFEKSSIEDLLKSNNLEINYKNCDSISSHVENFTICQVLKNANLNTK
ncbi:MAG: hypothetical protein HEQ13_00300 [Dolichospermum sp. DEX189]|nr:hypothetical protein [Dolichospermum sp. DEX189]